MNEAPSQVYKDPAKLRLHPLQKRIASPDETSEKWHAFVDALQAAGPDGIPPLIVTPDGLIMDGGWRWRAAKQLQWDRILCVTRPEEQAAVIIVETLIHRKQMTLGACVYMALGLLPEFVQSAEARRIGNLKVGRKTREKPVAVESVAELCERWGIGEETYKRAKQVHKLFAESPITKARLEPQLLSGEKNLWNIISGTAGAKPENQQGRDRAVVESQLDLFEHALDNLGAGGKTWKRLDEPKRDELLEKWRAAITKWPAEMRAAMLAELQALEEK